MSAGRTENRAESPKITKEHKMKKKIAIAVAVLAAVAAPTFAVAMHNHEHGIHAFRCTFCKGTGFQNGNGNTACFACKGTGFNGSY